MNAVLLVVMLVGCGGGSGGAGAPAGGAPVPVAVEPVVAAPLDRTVSATGTVEAVDSAELRPEAAGLVEAVLFTDGEAVTKGQPLVRLRSEDARAGLQDARARASLASVDLARQSALFDKGDLAKADLEKAVAADALARAAVTKAEEALRRTTIVAPFAGVAGRRDVSVGELVDPSRVITRVEGLGALVVDVALPETALATVAVGQAVAVEADALGGAPLVGTVRYVAPRLREDTRTVDVRVGLDAPDPRLRPGMTATVSIVTAHLDAAVVIPAGAVVRSSSGNAVYVLQGDGTVAQKPVTTGERQGDRVEVVTGLAAGDTLVTEGFARLRPGAKVTVAGDAPAAGGAAAAAGAR